jgi:hypothetical protein
MTNGGGGAGPEVALRDISTTGFRPPASPPAMGAAPMLQWIALELLVVDERYQRPIYGAGHQNVQRIAEEFRWSKFAPLIVAPIPGGKYAIIDGQHRATAAALVGADTVPAQVVIADLVEQAAAFKAINGQVTRMHRLALQHAAISAGDADALALRQLCEAAGVTVLRYPKQVCNMVAGETLALGSIAKALATFGRDTVITALTCVTETTNNKPGILNGPIIKALCDVLGVHTGWREAGSKLLSAFDEIDLELELEEARLTRRPKGTAVHEVLAMRLRTELAEALGA